MIFLDHPRTAGTSTQWGLAKIGGKTHKRHGMIYGRAEVICSTVRNPYDALVSWYLILLRRNHFEGTFLSFIEGYQNYNFTRGGRLFYFIESCTDIMRFETLQEDLDRVLDKAKLTKIKLHHRNRTVDRLPYQTYYGDAEKAAVQKRFAMDLEEFGYTYE
jgi:hypothetical protein